MTQRNTLLQTFQATPIGVPESLRVAPGLAPAFVLTLLVLVLITVLHGAGFGYV